MYRPPWTVLTTFVTALVACSSSQPTQPSDSAAAVIPRVVALGDSLTAGPGLRAEETYPASLQQRIRAAGLPHLVVNAGVSGDTTAGALARLNRALVPDTAVLIVALGANDGLQGVPVASVERNLDAIIERAKQRGVRVLLCGMETPPTRGWEYTLEFHSLFPELARKHGVPLMPFLIAGVVGRPELNMEDGWHPNAAGAKVIAASIWPHLEPLLR
jgi:acyl-CoA thioesterase-1